MVATAAARPPAPEARRYSKEYEDHREALLRTLSQLPAPAGSPSNMIGGHFRILTQSPLPELDTTLARAFAAQDEHDPARSLYALVCSPQMPVRGNVVKALTGIAVPHLVTLHASGLAEISGLAGHRYVLVYDRPQGKNLVTLLEERQRPFPESFIMEHVVGPLASVIQALSEHGLSHGRINPHSIYFSDTVTLGECAAEPCGYSQHYQFEPPDRAQAHPAGKGESTPAQDYFSLGVLAVYLRLGDRLFEPAPTHDEHILRLLRHGSYYALTHNIEFSDAMTDLLRGTLNDRPEERWTWQQFRPWATGRRYNMLPPAQPPQSTRPFVIEQAEYSGPRDLAHGLTMHWEYTLRVLRDGNLIRWLDMSARRKDLGELLRRTTASLSDRSARSSHQNDELIARTLTMLDPQAPLTMRESRAHIAGIGGLLAEGYRSGQPQHVQRGLEMIEQGLPTVWADLYKRREEVLPGAVTDMLWLLDRMRMVVRMPGYGFGIERVLYDLNPELACQSPLLGGHHTATLKDLLLILDGAAADTARSDPPIDRHIAGFVASRLSLTREPTLSEYANTPRLAQHRAFIALRLLEQAQDACGKPRVPRLTAWLSIALLEAVEEFHSKTARRQLQAGLTQLADNGLVGALTAFINQRAFSQSDMAGYREAIENHYQMTQEIARLRDRRHLSRTAAIGGYAVAKYIAHVALLLAALFVLKDIA